MIDEKTLADWSDWSEHGGRWSTVIEGSVLRYPDDPETFNRVINEFRESTEQEVVRIVKEIGHLSIDELVGDPRYSFGFARGEDDEEKPTVEEESAPLDEEEQDRKRRKGISDSLACYQAIRVLEITQGRFTPDTHFYDVESWDAGRKWLDERIKEKPEQQFIVMWDFHY